MLSLSSTNFLRAQTSMECTRFVSKKSFHQNIILEASNEFQDNLSYKQIKELKSSSSSTKRTLLTDLNDGTFMITINRPEKLNALNKGVIEELSDAIDEIYNNPDVKTAIITGAGEKAFVAGADISELANLDEKGGAELALKGQTLIFNKIEKSPKPIIAAVNGFALGGGLELALSCHMIIASERALFGLPEVNLGVIPAYGGTQRLTWRVGKPKALELMMTADKIGADEAKALRLVNDVVPSSQVLPKAIEIAKKIQKKAPLAISKLIICANNAEKNNPNGFAGEIKLFGDCFNTKDMLEGTNAFLEKRPPNFKGE